MKQSHELQWAVKWAEEKPGGWSRFEGPLATILQKLFCWDDSSLPEPMLKGLPQSMEVMGLVTFGTECQVILRLEIPD